MRILIVGAGIGGLSSALALSLAGHAVTILESASQLAEVGAGVQLTPNATKAFWKWGLGPDILQYALLPPSFNIRDLVSGELIGGVALKVFMEQYGAPYIVIHRADIHRILHEHAVKAGVKVCLGSKVVKYDVEGGKLWLADGQEMNADLVVACDGIHSFARGVLHNALGGGDGLEKTGWAAYRKMAPVMALKANPLTESLATDHSGNCWIGEEKLVMTYLVQGASNLNIVLSHPDNVDTSDWASEKYDAEIGRLFQDAGEVVNAVLDLSKPGAVNYPVFQTKDLPSWSSKSGKFLLMGDAAHAMAFYLSMGVSMAVEDAETLAECISLKTATEVSLQKAVEIFSNVRKPRAEAVRNASLHAGNIMQLRQGPEQEMRNRSIREDGAPAGREGEDKDFYVTAISFGIADRRIRDWCYGYDVAQEVYLHSNSRGP